jgi:hypothetical protein
LDMLSVRPPGPCTLELELLSVLLLTSILVTG